MENSKYFASVQTLRGVAAVMVVVFHLPSALGFDLHLPILFGGVDLFFVISGFVMVMSTMDKRSDALGFVKGRLLRVVPMYWIVTALLLLVWTFGGLRHANWGEIVQSLLFVPYYDTTEKLTQPLLAVGWTLNLELAFYAVFAATMWLPMLAQIGTITALFCGAVAVRVIFDPAEESVLFFYTTPMLLEFVMGMAVGAALPLVRKIPVPIALIAGAVAAASAIYAGVSADLPRSLALGVPAAVLLAVAVVAEPVFRLPAFRDIRRLGDASYSLYLIHPIVLLVAAPVLRQLPWYAAGVILLGLCWATALLSFAYLERPLLRTLRGPTSPRPVVATT
jgi:exopolysaccharide production protein ExoZ